MMLRQLGFVHNLQHQTKDFCFVALKCRTHPLVSIYYAILSPNLMRLDTVSYKLEIYDFDPYFWKIILPVWNQELTFLCKTTYIDLEFFHRSFISAVAMTSMTFQDGRRRGSPMSFSS